MHETTTCEIPFAAISIADPTHSCRALPVAAIVALAEVPMLALAAVREAAKVLFPVANVGEFDATTLAGWRSFLTSMHALQAE